MTQAVSDETVDTEVQTGQEQQEQHETNAPGDQPGGDGGEQQEQHQEGEDDEVVVSLGDSPPPEDQDESRAPEWVRELRKQNREKDRRIRELEARVASPAQAQPAAVVVGEKPTLESCNYDATKFETDLEAWHQRKREADAKKDEIEKRAKQEQEAWQATLQTYGEEKSALKVKDFEEAEEAVRSVFSVTQQGIVLHGVDKGRRAAVVYALGKNPQKLKELSAIADPVKFSFAVAKLEMQVKVTPKKTVPAPERRVQSSVAGAAVVDNQLEKLREEARKTGDLSKVVAYNRQKRAG